jgi:DNA-binding MarR family transcriptional regulator
MIEQAPGVTRLLDRLQAKSLVRRQRSAEDRRQIRCWITPAGLELLDRLEAAMQDGGRAFMAPLSATDLATFVRLLDALRAGPSAAPKPSTDVAATRTSRAPVPHTRR